MLRERKKNSAWTEIGPLYTELFQLPSEGHQKDQILNLFWVAAEAVLNLCPQVECVLLSSKVPKTLLQDHTLTQIRYVVFWNECV